MHQSWFVLCLLKPQSAVRWRHWEGDTAACVASDCVFKNLAASLVEIDC